MAIRKIRFIGDPCLNKVCKPVQKITPSIETLIEDMLILCMRQEVLVLQHHR